MTHERRPARLAALAALALLVAGGTACSLVPTQRERLASLNNDHTFLQQERDRLCNPVAFKGCDAAKRALDRMKDHIDNAAKVSKDGHITLQLKALRRDKKAALASGIFFK